MTDNFKINLDLLESTLTIVQNIRHLVEAGQKIVFVSGNFNVVHPGHLRLLNFASEVGDFLVVGLHGDGHPGVFVPIDSRRAGLQAISRVGKVVLLKDSPTEFIAALKPDVVVKGKEHESSHNPEQEIIKSYGGKLLFTSGESRFSSLDLLQRELRELELPAIRQPTDYLIRHSIDQNELRTLVNRFKGLRIAVVGDLIVDEYITCDPLGMSQEDPTIVVTPIKHDKFVGGAGIVAAHAKGMNAQVDFFSVVGHDDTAEFAERTLKEYGVSTHFIRDENRPTTLKQRFRSRGKTLLRVNRLRQNEISRWHAEAIIDQIAPVLSKADLLIFSDFNYGCLPQFLVDAICELCKKYDVKMVADSQSSSQVGDVSRFRNMLLITPTEHEARLSTRESGAGLVVLAEALRKNANAEHIFITLGDEGLLIHSMANAQNGIVTDQLIAFNHSPKDVSGAGDCMLACSSMALVVGATVWQAAYIGSMAAACQVGRIGNLPLNSNQLLSELQA
jgi:rfaE bifunctional protein kinase chain/domain